MLQLSNNDFATQQWDDAYEHLDRVLELLPDTASTWPAVVSRQIVVLGHLNRLTEARQLFMRSLLFNMLSRLVITFLPRSKLLLISWLQSPSVVILEPKKSSLPLFPHLFAMK